MSLVRFRLWACFIAKDSLQFLRYKNSQKLQAVLCRRQKYPAALLEEARFSEYPISEIMGCLKGKCSLMVQMMMCIKACDYLKNILE